MTAEKYTKQSHENKVLNASECKGATRLVLYEICRRLSFTEPLSTFAKIKVQQKTRVSEKSVERAVRELREEGVLVPVRGYRGGGDRAVTYRVCVVREVEEETNHRKCPPELFSRWHHQHGIDGAHERKRRYQEGEEIED